MQFTKIDFDIKKRNDALSIHPLEHFDSYLFIAEKFAEGIKLETNADEFPLNGNNDDFCINLGENC